MEYHEIETAVAKVLGNIYNCGHDLDMTTSDFHNVPEDYNNGFSIQTAKSMLGELSGMADLNWAAEINEYEFLARLYKTTPEVSGNDIVAAVASFLTES